MMLRIASDGHVPRLLILRLRQVSLLTFILSLLGSILFHTLCEGIHGSTPGKLLFSMMVVKETGSPCGLKAALIRSLAYLIDSLFFGLVANAAMQDSEMHQRLGDKWAGTVVCRRLDVPPTSLQGSGRFVMACFFAVIVDSALCCWPFSSESSPDAIRGGELGQDKRPLLVRFQREFADLGLF